MSILTWDTTLGSAWIPRDDGHSSIATTKALPAGFRAANNLTGRPGHLSPAAGAEGRLELILTELRFRSVAATIRVSESGAGSLTVLQMEPAGHRTANLESSPAGVIQPVEHCLLH